MTCWYDKHEPRAFSDLVLPDDSSFRRQVSNWIDGGEISRRGLILYGAPGTGKTSFNELLLKELGVPEIAILRGNDAGEIKATLVDVEKFLEKEYGIFANNTDTLYIVIDEIDRSSAKFISGLSGISDKFSRARGAKFLFTTNDFKALNKYESFVGRFFCQSFDKPSRQDILRLLERILERERAECNPDILGSIINDHYPSVRKIIDAVQTEAIPMAIRSAS